MKENTHPEYREVVFMDMSSNDKVLTRSTIKTRETTQYEGKEYPLAKMEISSASHPFYTGQNKIVDSEGTVEKFNRKYASYTKAVKTPDPA